MVGGQITKNVRATNIDFLLEKFNSAAQWRGVYLDPRDANIKQMNHSWETIR